MSVSILTDISAQKPQVNVRCQDLIVDGTATFNTPVAATSVAPSPLPNSVLVSDSVTTSWSANPVVGSIQFPGVSQSALNLYYVTAGVLVNYSYSGNVGQVTMSFVRIGNIVTAQFDVAVSHNATILDSFKFIGIPAIFVPSVLDKIVPAAVNPWIMGAQSYKPVARVTIFGDIELYDENIPIGAAPQPGVPSGGTLTWSV